MTQGGITPWELGTDDPDFFRASGAAGEDAAAGEGGEGGEGEGEEVKDEPPPPPPVPVHKVSMQLRREAHV